MAFSDNFNNSMQPLVPQQNAPSGGQNLTPQQQAAWNQMWQQQQMANQQGFNNQLNQLRLDMERKALENPQQKYSPVKLGPDGKVQLKDEFKMSGPEAYIQQQMGKQQLEEAAQRDIAQQAQAQGLNTIGAQAAMRGGRKSGAMANLQRQSLRDLMAQRQGVARQGMLDRSNLGIQGEELRRKTEAANLATMLGGGEAADKFGLDIWTRNKAAEAAKTSAAATRAAAQDSSKK